MRALLSGNEAVAEGALAAGCSFFAAYPITPSSEIAHYMARELPKRGGVFIQAEDELAAINMVIGASWAGARAMTATSGPGFSLMQEGIGYAIMTETPLVVVNVMRAGPATGQATKPAQGDVMQARWGRHGDQMLVVLAPASPQEAYDLTAKAFDIAERLRTPVVVLTDEFIAHGREVVELHPVEVASRRIATPSDEIWFASPDPRSVAPMPVVGRGLKALVTGSTHNERGYRDVHSMETHMRLVTSIRRKILENMHLYPQPEVMDFGSGRPRAAILSFGSVSRSARRAARMLGSEGIAVRFVRLRTLWPVDYGFLRKALEEVDRVFVPELSLGQLIYDAATVVGWDRVVPINRVGGGIPIYAEEIVEHVKKLLR